MLPLLSKITIRSKVLIAFVALLMTMLALGGFAIQRLGAVNHAATDVRDKWLPSTLVLGKMTQASEHSLAYLALSGFIDSKEESLKEEALFKNEIASIEALRREYEPLINTGAERGLAGEMDRNWQSFLAAVPGFLTIVRNKEGDQQGTAYWLSEIRPIFAKFRTAINANVEFNEQEGIKAGNGSAAIYLSARTMIIGGLALASLLCLAAGAILIASVSRPIQLMTLAMNRLAGGDKTVEIPARDSKDEIGAMAQAVDIFKQNMIRAEGLATEQGAEQASKTRRQAAIERHIVIFQTAVSVSLDTLAKAASEMQTTSQGMSDTAEETSMQASTVASAAEQASVNVQTVATATEELSASVGEIARQVTQSTKIAGQAVEQAVRTNETVLGLSAAAQKIGDVVKLISDIAGQTNLLALNATIEAARAGEAGRGFAVVASEVKSLANQTAKATQDISAQVAAMQGATREAVEAIKGIGATIGSVNEIATTIAAAVEQQGSATQEISRNVLEAAQGTGQVSSTIADVNLAAGNTGVAANQVLDSARGLDAQAKTLRANVDSFLANIRAA
jgi:methyl-accepting chemotaxis protein